jgi:aerobic carbon-monoxide dehydrogenase medium subunit
LKPADFEYHRPRKIEEALSLLGEFGDDGKILAGGQSLMPLMNFRLAQPAHIIDINFIDGMDYARSDEGVIKIGCLARQSHLLDSQIVRERCPLLSEALTYVGYEQIRNRGTMCGSLAHADPAAELPAVLLALDGFVTVRNLRMKREIAARDFFKAYLTTSLSKDEMVLEASIPETPPGAGWSFMEFARRNGDFAIVGVAVLLLREQEKISDARIALTGVGDKPWREPSVEQMLVGQKASTDLFAKVGAEIAAQINPGADIHASESYKRSLASVLARRALDAAWRKARNHK